MEGEKEFHCKMSGFRSLYHKVPGACNGLALEGANMWSSIDDTTFMEHGFQRVVDVGSTERTLVWCRKCAGWASARLQIGLKTS